MKAYSIDLRERIVQAVERGTPKSVLARLLGIGRATISRYVRQQRTTGNLAPKAAPGAPPLIPATLYPALIAQLEAAPDATLAEHCETWERAQGVRVSLETMRRALVKIDWRLKKKTITASERDEAAREEWRKEAAKLDLETIVVVDETHATVTMTRRYGRAPGGERAIGSVPRNQGVGTTLVAGLTTSGIEAPMALEGALDTLACVAYVREVLCPILKPGQIVIWDNLNVHKGAEVRQLIADAGCELLFLPAYSPDLSPIELAFSKIKEALRAAGARTQDSLIEAIKASIDQITHDDAMAYFRHCGYGSQAQS